MRRLFPLLALLLLLPLSVAVGANSYTVTIQGTAVTEQQVRDWLDAAGYEPHTGLAIVSVVDVGATSASVGGGCYPDFSACWVFPASIQFTDDALLLHPYYSAGHEYGHVWANYYLWTYWNGKYDAYLTARGIALDDPNLAWGTPSCWNPEELVADDYQQLFAAPETNPNVTIVSCAWQIGVEPYDVPGFVEWYATVFTQGHPPPGYGRAYATPTPTATATATPTATATVTPTPEVTPTPKPCRGKGKRAC